MPGRQPPIRAAAWTAARSAGGISELGAHIREFLAGISELLPRRRTIGAAVGERKRSFSQY